MYLYRGCAKKTLPRPCPQCGMENGGCQWVIFNPRYYKQKFAAGGRWKIEPYKDDSYSRRLYGPYILLRISHYSKEKYELASRLKKKNNTKIWHTFQIAHAPISLTIGSENVGFDEIFNIPRFKFKHSISFVMAKDTFERIRKNGWPPIRLERAHWVNRSSRFEGRRAGRKKGLDSVVTYCPIRLYVGLSTRFLLPILLSFQCLLSSTLILY